MQNHNFFLGAHAALGLFSLVVPASSQGFLPSHPFSQTLDFYVSDTGDDAIYRFQDRDLDGKFNSLVEVTSFYDDSLGDFELSNNSGIAVGPTGIVYVTDNSKDKVFGLFDFDQDGECNDPGESWVFFDGDPGINQDNIEMARAANLDIDATGRLYVAVAATITGPDMILILEDKNFDRDANDFGEARIFYDIAPGGAFEDSNPQDVVIGLDGHLYYLETGTTGVLAKGIYRLDDADGSGSIDQPGEAAPFFIPPPLSQEPFFWGLSVDASGYFYLADTGDDNIWKVRDEDGNKVVDLSEQILYGSGKIGNLIYKCVPGSDGSLLCAESQSPDRVLSLIDANQDGTIDPLTEVTEVYDENLAWLKIGNPRSIAWARRPTLSANSLVSINSVTSFITQASEGDTVIAYWSINLGSSLPVPPLGDFELSLVPGETGIFYVGTVLFTGFHVFSPQIPNNPNLVGKSLHAQAIAGSFPRPVFTNSVTQTYKL